MKYCFNNLNPNQFEDLVVLICKELFGIGFKGFSIGKDGGRDGYFYGTAECFPSSQKPWTGITIVQAKHCSKYSGSFSESDFFKANVGSKATLNQEIPKIQKLKKNNSLDNYFLFSNRALTGMKFNEITNFIYRQCDIPLENIAIWGDRDIQEFLEGHPEIYNRYINELDPLDFSPNIDFRTLAEIIEDISDICKSKSTIKSTTSYLKRISFEEKNKQNRLNQGYADHIKNKFLIYSSEISNFLRLPENNKIRQLYEDTATELNCKILTYQKEHDLNEVFETLIFKRCFEESTILNNHKQETRALIYHMYWACDIGTKYVPNETN